MYSLVAVYSFVEVYSLYAHRCLCTRLASSLYVHSPGIVPLLDVHSPGIFPLCALAWHLPSMCTRLASSLDVHSPGIVPLCALAWHLPSMSLSA